MTAESGSVNEAKSRPGLVRALGVWSTVAVIAGAMIGQSVFLVTSDMARELGSTTEVLVAWLAGGAVALLGSFCLAELGAAMPEAGGEYVYLSRGLGPLWGFLYGWASAVVLRPTSSAFIAAGLARFAGFLHPSLANPVFSCRMATIPGVQPYQFTLAYAQLLAAAVIVLLTAINCLRVRTAGRLQIWLTSFKVAVLVVIVILACATRKPGGALPLFAGSFFHGGLSPLLIAIVPVMAAYSGFPYFGHIGGEIVDPQRNLPRAAILAPSLVIILYLLLNWSYFRVLGFSQVAHSPHVASDTVAALLGDRGARWLTVIMIVSAFGSLHANFLTGPRVTYAMATNRLFFSFAGRLHPSFHTPVNAVLFQGCAAILLVLTGTYQELYSLLVFATGIFFSLIACALVRLRVTQPNLPRPYRAWGYPVTPVIFGVTTLATSLHLIVARPMRSSIGVGVVLLGIPFFRYWRKRSALDRRRGE